MINILLTKLNFVRISDTLVSSCFISYFLAPPLKARIWGKKSLELCKLSEVCYNSVY